MKSFKKTTFREGYKPTFSEFKKSHSNVIALEDMAEAYETITGKKPNKKQLKDIEVNNKLILGKDGNTSTATSKGREAKPTTSS
ncbi:hypothetical protein [uncultured Wocania sp.]|uniref:hypothetical protein n=1 Tax=uncultured Wocania sp. TaxID=2834404 RepID=UPI0030F5E554